jgi:hypothetical protein
VEIATKLTPRESGLIGSRRRWGPHGRILRLDQLDPVTKSIVLAILDAQANAKKAVELEASGAPAQLAQ